MRTATLLLAIMTLCILCSCGMVISGTGQHGEAKVIGMVSMKSGEPASRLPITVSSSDYIPERQIFRTATSTDIFTDKNGYFEFTIPADEIVTLSARFCNDLLYIPNLTASNYEKAEDCQFQEGVPYSIYPWWESNDEVDVFAVQGTDWTFTVKDSGKSELLLPPEMITLIHKDETTNYEVNASLDNSIGEPGTYAPLVTIPDTLQLNKAFTITVNRELSGTEEGIKFWPDLYNSAVEPIYFSGTNSFEYRYADGTHTNETVYIKVLINRKDTNGELIAEEFTKVVVLIP